MVDLGIRLEDVQEHNLPSEPCHVRSNWKTEENLRENGASQEEIEYLCNGERVELNAFMSEEFIEWIEGKLKKHGVKKVVPDEDTLADAYRRALKIAAIDERLDEMEQELEDEVDGAKVPKTLGRKVRRLLKDSPSMAWDAAVLQIAEESRKDAQ